MKLLELVEEASGDLSRSLFLILKNQQIQTNGSLFVNKIN